jgi:excisionase family DNA binding protein
MHRREDIDMGDWITTDKAAKLLGVSRRRVLQLIESGALEATKLNPRLWMIKRESVEEYRASQ